MVSVWHYKYCNRFQTQQQSFGEKYAIVLHLLLIVTVFKQSSKVLMESMPLFAFAINSYSFQRKHQRSDEKLANVYIPIVSNRFQTKQQSFD